MFWHIKLHELPFNYLSLLLANYLSLLSHTGPQSVTPRTAEQVTPRTGEQDQHDIPHGEQLYHHQPLLLPGAAGVQSGQCM